MNRKIKDIASFLVIIIGIIILYTVLGIGCPVKYVTGISCAGCGMTRAYEALFHLEFGAAFAYHPLFWCVPIVFLIYMFRDRFQARTRKVLLISIIVIFVAVYISRLIYPGDTVVEINIRDGLVGRLIQKLS